MPQFVPTSGHQRNYRAQAVIPGNNRLRSNRTSAVGADQSHGRLALAHEQSTVLGIPPNNGAKASARDVRQLRTSLLPTSSCSPPLAGRRHRPQSVVGVLAALGEQRARELHARGRGHGLGPSRRLHPHPDDPGRQRTRIRHSAMSELPLQRPDTGSDRRRREITRSTDRVADASKTATAA